MTRTALTLVVVRIRFSHYEIGRRAAELLIGQIEGDQSAPRTLVVATELVVRGSTGAPSPTRAPAAGAP